MLKGGSFEVSLSREPKCMESFDKRTIRQSLEMSEPRLKFVLGPYPEFSYTRSGKQQGKITESPEQTLSSVVKLRFKSRPIPITTYWVLF